MLSSTSINEFLPIVGNRTEYEAEHCHCDTSDKYPHVMPYCNKWFDSHNSSYCILKGGLLSRYCPGSRKLTGKDMYVTSDESICNASIGEILIFDERLS